MALYNLFEFLRISHGQYQWLSECSFAGKFYIKLGHADDILKYDLKEEEIRGWYCGPGDRELEGHMFRLLQGIFPGKP